MSSPCSHPDRPVGGLQTPALGQSPVYRAANISAPQETGVGTAAWTAAWGWVARIKGGQLPPTGSSPRVRQRLSSGGLFVFTPPRLNRSAAAQTCTFPRGQAYRGLSFPGGGEPQAVPLSRPRWSAPRMICPSGLRSREVMWETPDSLAVFSQSELFSVALVQYCRWPGRIIPGGLLISRVTYAGLWDMTFGSFLGVPTSVGGKQPPHSFRSSSE